MKAIVVKKTDREPILSWQDVPDVTYGPEEVLVDIKATAVNRADLLQAQGLYPPPSGESEILLGLLSGGGYAQQVAIHPQMLMRLPDSWSFTEGAAIPEVWLTAFSNLFMEGALQSGERVMLHAGGSGVGTAGIQLARAAGATVYATAGNEAKLAKCRELGARLAVNYKKQDFCKEVMGATEKQGVDLILDPVGAAYLSQNLNLLRVNGRLVIIGLLSGRTVEIDLGAVLGKGLRIIGTRLRARPLTEKILITREFKERFWPLLEQGRLQPVIDRVFPIEAAQVAHALVRQNINTGKVVLEM